MTWKFVVAFLLSVSAFANESSDRLTQENYYEFANHSISGSARSSFVKLMVEWDGSTLKNVEFFNSNTYKFHADFLRTKPGYQKITDKEIDQITLFKASRKFYFVTFMSTYIDDQHPEKKSFDIVSSDDLEANEVINIFKQLKKSIDTDIASSLSYYPSPNQRETAHSQIPVLSAEGIEVLFPESLEEEEIYSAYSWGIGKIKFVAAAEFEQMLQNNQITSTDILIFDQLPRRIPIVAGVATSEASSPFSHVAMLSKMMNIPFIYKKGIFNDPKLREAAAQKRELYLSAGPTGVDVVTVDSKSANYLRKLKLRPVTSIQLPLVTSNSPLKDLTALNLSDTATYGSKASNLGFLLKQLPASEPIKGFGIPFYYYAQFIKEGTLANGEALQAFISKNLTVISEPNADYSLIAAKLTGIRAKIIEATVSDTISQPITDKLLKMFPEATAKVKFRSSSNAEDAENFNGAGLYDSDGVKAPFTKEKVAKNLKKIWASLYNFEAFLARKNFGIKENQVAMAVLVNNAFQGELAAGVAVVSMTEFSDRVGVKIVGFPGEKYEVVSPPPGILPEVAEVKDWGSGQPEISIDQYTTELPVGRQLMPDAGYHELYNKLTKVYAGWIKTHPQQEKVELDVEWKWIAQGDKNVIVVKQVRPIPKPKKDNLKFPVYVNDGKLYTHIGERPDSILALQANIVLEFDAGVIPFDLDADLSQFIKGASIQFRDGTQEIVKFGPNSLKVNIEVENDIKTYTITGKLPNSHIPNLRFSMIEQLYEEVPQVSMMSPPRLETLKKDFPMVPADLTDLSWFTSKVPTGLRGSCKKPFPSPSVYVGNSVRIDIQALTCTAGFDKTHFEYIEKVTITGLTANPITIESPMNTVYAAAHHNFGWEYLFDLHYANFKNPQEMEQAFKELGGPYFQIESGKFDDIIGRILNKNWKEVRAIPVKSGKN